MRDTDWTPSIVPGDEDRDVCMVVNDFGRRGSAYCETDVEATDLETVIQDLLDGQYCKRIGIQLRPKKLIFNKECHPTFSYCSLAWYFGLAGRQYRQNELWGRDVCSSNRRISQESIAVQRSHD